MSMVSSIDKYKYENLLVDITGNICTVSINRPKALNALNEELYKDIYDMFMKLKDDEEIDIVIITGEGRAFVAGADIKYMSGLDTKDGKVFGELGAKTFAAISDLNKVVIGAINGYALGGGCELALACDIRIASENAKFGQPEVSLGMIPGSGGTQRLSRIVGEGKAKELIFTGNVIDANEAFRIGLVNKVVSPEILMDEVYDLAKKILSNGIYAVKFAKEAIAKGRETDINTGLNIESNLFGLCFGTGEVKEGTSAFMEKRKAVFTKK